MQSELAGKINTQHYPNSIDKAPTTSTEFLSLVDETRTLGKGPSEDTQKVPISIKLQTAVC